MAGFQAEMDSALVSRLTQPDQKLMKSKEIEEEKKRRSSEWPWRLGLEWKKLKNQGGGSRWKGFYFRRLIMTADVSNMFLSLGRSHWKMWHFDIFFLHKIWSQKSYRNKQWEFMTHYTGHQTTHTTMTLETTCLASENLSIWNGGINLYIIPWFWCMIFFFKLTQVLSCSRRVWHL